jgi:hypothetical protein
MQNNVSHDLRQLYLDAIYGQYGHNTLEKYNYSQ